MSRVGSTFHFWNSVGAEDIAHASEARFRGSSSTSINDNSNNSNNNNINTSSVGREAEKPTTTTQSGDGKSDFSSQSTVTSVKSNSSNKGNHHNSFLPNWGNSPNLDQISPFESFRDPQLSSPSSADRGSLPPPLLGLAARDQSPNSSSSIAHMSSHNYLPSSNSAQADALQTLYLMDQGAGYPGYGNSPNNSNTMLLPTNGGSLLGGIHINTFSSPNQHHPQYNHHHQQQHYHHHQQQQQSAIGFLNSSSLHLPHEPHHAILMPNTGHHNPSSIQQTSHVYNSWEGVNGIPFFPPGGGGHEEVAVEEVVEEGSLPIATRVVDPVSNLSMYGSTAPFNHENSTLFPPPNLVDNLQRSRGQILSLSLSPQQPPMIQQAQAFPLLQHQDVSTSFFHSLGADCKEGILSQKVHAGLAAVNHAVTNPNPNTFTSPSCDSFGASYHLKPPNNTDSSGRQMNMFGSHFIVGAYQSKYLKPAQDLLNEVVNVGKPAKSKNNNDSHNNALKRSWVTPAESITNDDTSTRDNSLSNVSDKAMISWSKKEEDSIATAIPINQTTGSSEKRTEENVELTATERQELQAKRAKLVGMRDEVDRRYKQYYNQMQAVVASFESTGGLGAATAYTCLALQTISKHFRCLRDAITRQIELACKALGDEDVSGGLVKGAETSKLRLIGQQLRQQRALRQLGIMQQQAWRPQRGLPEHSVSILRAWLFENFLNPYPKDADKMLLARQTGLSRNQVSNWFINARVRLWKPMVEEMYLEETKEAEAEGAAERLNRDEGEGNHSVTTASEVKKASKQAKLLSESRQDEGKGLSSGYGASSEMQQGKKRDGPSAAPPISNLHFSEKEGMMMMRQGVIMSSKHVLQDGSSLLAPGASAGGMGNADDGVLDEMKIRTSAEDGYRESSGNGENNGYMQQSDHLGMASYASYPMNALSNRYSQDGFPGGYLSGNGGISLTLGLQHCEGTSPLSGPSYGHGQAHLPTSRPDEAAAAAAAAASNGAASVDYYTMNDSGFESLGLQNRKPFTTHMLRHDFVV